MSTELIILLAVIVAILFYVIGLYNKLIKLRENRSNAFSDIDIQLKQRFDLIPQLVSTVKGYAGHESKIFEEVTRMRSKVSASNGINERAKAEGALSSSLTNLFAVAENYPNLKADSNFMHLQEELSDIENKLAAARRYFNNATNEYNTASEQFPTIIIARMMNFQRAAFFDVPQTRKEILDQAPEIKF